MTTQRKIYDLENKGHVEELLKMLDDEDEDDIIEDFAMNPILMAKTR